MSFAVGDIVEANYDFWLIESISEGVARCLRVKDVRRNNTLASLSRTSIVVYSLRKSAHTDRTIINALCDKDSFIRSVIYRLKGNTEPEPVRTITWSDGVAVRHDIPVLRGVSYGEAIVREESELSGIYYADTTNNEAIVFCDSGKMRYTLKGTQHEMPCIYSYHFESWKPTDSPAIRNSFLHILRAYPDASFFAKLKLSEQMDDALYCGDFAITIYKTNTVKDFACITHIGHKLVPHGAQEIKGQLHIARNLCDDEQVLLKLDPSLACDNTPFSIYPTPNTKEYISNNQFKLIEDHLHNKEWPGVTIRLQDALEERLSVKLLDEDISAEGTLMIDAIKVYVIKNNGLYILTGDGLIAKLPRELLNRICRCHVCQKHGARDTYTRNGEYLLCEECIKLPVQSCSVCKIDLPIVGYAHANRRTVVYCARCGRTQEEAGHIEYCRVCNEYHTWDFPCLDMKAQIRNYSYQPKKMIRIGRTRKFKFYMGVELELATPVPIEVSKAIVRKYPGLFYFKSDASVAGLECVSMPCARNRWSRFDPSFLSASELRVTHENAGIHVHVDRSGFTNQQIRNILKLMYENEEEVYTVAERRSDKYARIVNPETSFSALHDLSKQVYNHDEKYMALNFCHKKTLEYRIFDSTIKPLNFQKNLDFVCSLWDYTKEGSLSSTPTWAEYRSLVKSEVTYFGHLDKFLTSKGK